MADKHIITLEVLREYGVDLSIEREVEFNIVSLSPINIEIIQEFASHHGMQADVEEIDGLSLATLTARLVITEQSIRLLSEEVERFTKEHEWDYDGWGAFSYK